MQIKVIERSKSGPGPSIGAGSDSSDTALPSWLRSAPAAAMVIPLVALSRPLGVMYLWDANTEHSFTESDLRLARGLAELAALAIANALAYQESMERITRQVQDLQAMVRRLQRGQTPRQRRVITADGLSIDGDRKHVTLMGKPVSLSPTEFELLFTLAQNAGTPLSQDVLFRQVWGVSYRGQSNIVDVSIHRLRRKIEEDPGAPRRILTVRGAGYLFSDGRQRSATA
jgi:DNA-binding winged helix-turn-helix (wHTH) protein